MGSSDDVADAEEGPPPQTADGGVEHDANALAHALLLEGADCIMQARALLHDEKLRATLRRRADALTHLAGRIVPCLLPLVG